MTRKILAEGKYARFIIEGAWEYVERPHGNRVVFVVPVTANREIVLVEQYRFPVKAQVIELCAGLVGDTDPAETTATAAARELEEETGYTAPHFELLTTGPFSPGLTAEIGDFYLAANAVKTAKGGGIDDENIIVHVVPLAEADDWLNAQAAAGKLIDTKIYAGLYFANK